MIPADFFAKIAPYAVADFKTSKVLPSLTMAQAALESNWGESKLTKFGNNLFGIKGKGGMYLTAEYIAGKRQTIQAEFKHYDSWQQSIVDHSTLLGRKRYAKVIATTDWRVAIREIYIAGYATDPEYPKKLEELILRYGLYNYDIQAQEGEDDVEKITVIIDGKATSGFMKDGVTYVQARDIANAVKVNWDNKQKKLYVNTK